jgi:predicted AlkP superfamily phosphohydrolase/phosphomutase
MQKKALIIGIDGVPHGLINQMMEKGYMKELKSICDGGYTVHKMRASYPDISSVSWTSFMTGANPAEHGIFGFTDLKPNSYDLYFPNSRDIKAPTFWQKLRKEGKVNRTLVLNIPNTYPAFPIDGLLVSGFVAIDFSKAVYPPSYVAPLQRMGYVIDVDLMKVREDKDAFYQDLVESLAIRQSISVKLIAEDEWDVATICITETDRLHHFFYDKKDSVVFQDFYKRVDAFIANTHRAFEKRYNKDFLFLVLSDHGFTEQITEVNLNALLKDKGFLVTNESREYYDKIDAGTTAFAMDPGRIYVHHEKKFPRGHVKPSEVEQVKNLLKGALLGLADSRGTKVIKEILDKATIYSGPYYENAPDLICISREGYDLKGNLRKKDVFSSDVFTGMHTGDDATLITPKSITFDRQATIEDPARIIVEYFSESN